jgi:hypothetical protein
MTRDRAAVGAYRVLIRLYPRQFRREYGSDLVQLMREQRRDDRPMRVFARSAIDLAISIPHQHLEARMNNPPTRLTSVAAAIAAVAGVLLAVIGGSAPTTIVLGIGLAAIAGAVAVVAWRQYTPVREPAVLTASWWKFVLGGPCLVALVIAGAGAGLDAWYLGMVVVLGACISTATGLVLGAARIVSRRGIGGTPT